MAESVVIREGDLLIYRNQLLRYTEFLLEKRAEFRKILLDVKEFAFVDVLLGARLAYLLFSAMPLFQDVDQSIKTELKTIISQTVSEMDKADSFHYPDSLLERIRVLLSVFG